MIEIARRTRVAALAALLAATTAAPALAQSPGSPALGLPSSGEQKSAPERARAAMAMPQEVSAAAASGSELAPGTVLHQGEGIVSPNGQHVVILDAVLLQQGESNFEQLLEPDVDISTFEDDSGVVVMQGDGNLVHYVAGRPVWSTGTAGNPGAKLALQSDGNVVLYSAKGRPLWWTGVADYSYSFTDLPARSSAVLRSNWQLQSPNGRYKLVMQPDGNLVLYSPRRATWSSGSSGNPGALFALQEDGNMVVYSASGAVKWTSRTDRLRQPRIYVLQVQDDGNVVLSATRDTSQVLWQSRTSGVS